MTAKMRKTKKLLKVENCMGNQIFNEKYMFAGEKVENSS